MSISPWIHRCVERPYSTKTNFLAREKISKYEAAMDSSNTCDAMLHSSSRTPPPRLPTPYALIDHRRLSRNLARMQQLANDAGLALRPHVKTHKTLEIADLQLGLGAVGLTVSKPSEALPFARAGATSLFIAYPIVDPGRIETLIGVAKASGTALSFILDSEQGRQAVNEAGRNTGHRFAVSIKINVGLGRLGVEPDSDSLGELARSVMTSSHLRLAGLLTHAGHGYRAANTDELSTIAEHERRQIIAARDRLSFLGTALRLSVGSTPTVLSTRDFSGIDEIRPGNYALMDLTAVRFGVATEDDIALGVVATIVARNAESYIVDAGSKALTSDLGPHSSGRLSGFGKAMAIDRVGTELRLSVTRLSEEHGFIAREGSHLQIGERVLILPNHSCPVVNLYDRLVVQYSDRTESWTVAARGALT